MKDIGSRWWPTTRSLRNRDAIGGALPCPVEDSAPQGRCSPGGEVDVIGGRAPSAPTAMSPCHHYHMCNSETFHLTGHSRRRAAVGAISGWPWLANSMLNASPQIA